MAEVRSGDGEPRGNGVDRDPEQPARRTNSAPAFGKAGRCTAWKPLKMLDFQVVRPVHGRCGAQTLRPSQLVKWAMLSDLRRSAVAIARAVSRTCGWYRVCCGAMRRALFNARRALA